MKKRYVFAAAFFIIVILILSCGYYTWKTGPKTNEIFDKSTNGVWVGHQWYSGSNVRTKKAVSMRERDAFITKLHKYGIRDVFIHAGPVQIDGTLPEMPSAFFNALRASTPDIRYIPWIGGNAHELPLERQEWRVAFIETLGELYSRGFNGVHLDFEPLCSFHPGYLALLGMIRDVFEEAYFLSHATRRLDILPVAVPVISDHFWSASYYDVCMRTADQTVLMGYDTCLKLAKVYQWYIAHQTKKLLETAAMHPGHRVMIGVPSYEDVPKFSDPVIENIAHAAKGVRSALEQSEEGRTQLDGIAVYACWTTDSLEWKDYEVYWMGRY